MGRPVISSVLHPFLLIFVPRRSNAFITGHHEHGGRQLPVTRQLPRDGERRGRRCGGPRPQHRCHSGFQQRPGPPAQPCWGPATPQSWRRWPGRAWEAAAGTLITPGLQRAPFLSEKWQHGAAAAAAVPRWVQLLLKVSILSKLSTLTSPLRAFS